jgi:hypothetical protein
MSSFARVCVPPNPLAKWQIFNNLGNNVVPLERDLSLHSLIIFRQQYQHGGRVKFWGQSVISAT